MATPDNKQNQSVIEAFTDLAPRYEETMERELRQFWGISYPAFIDRLADAAQVRPGHHVLDVATGKAVIPSRILDQVGETGRVIGLDITLAMLRGARRDLGPRIHLVCGSGMAIPLADGSFDLAVCGLGTHHMDVPSLLSEMRRCLRPGGRLVIAEVVATAFWRSLAGAALLHALMAIYLPALGASRARAEREAFGNVRTAGEWQALAASLGFDQIATSELRPRRPWYPGGMMLTATKRGA